MCGVRRGSSSNSGSGSTSDSGRMPRLGRVEGSLQAELVPFRIPQLVIALVPRSPLLLDEADDRGTQRDQPVLLGLEGMVVRRRVVGSAGDVDVEVDAVSIALGT